MEKSASSNGTMDNVLYKPVETAKYDNIEEKIATSTSQDAMMECRSCLAGVQEDAWVDIFCPWSPPWSGMGLSMAEDLAKLAGIQISVSDPHSKIICKTCCTMLQNAINFMLNVQNSDMILRKRLKDSFTEASLWPKPIQIYNNIANEVLQEMEIEIDNIKQEVASDDEFDNNDACNELSDTRLETLDIKIEPEEITKQNILFEYKNSTIEPQEDNETSIPNGDAETHKESEELLQDVKKEPITDDEADAAPDIEKDCMLCTKVFNTVRGLKAHVIAVHSYDSVLTPKPPVDKSNKCPICNRCFETRTDLCVHETCHGQFACYVCDKKFDSFHQLSRHRTKYCKKRSVLPRLKTLDDVRRLLPPPSENKKFKSSHQGNVLQCNIDNVQGSASEVSLDINNLSENINTQYVINLKTVNSKISKAETQRNTDNSNKELKLNTNLLELINKAKMEDLPVVPCPMEHVSSEIDSEIFNKDIHIENNNKLEENNPVRQIETGILCIEMKKDICPYDENNCKDEVIKLNDNTPEMEIEKVICCNDANNYKKDEDSNDNTIGVGSNNLCNKEGSRIKLEVSNVKNVQLLPAITSETSSNDTLESEINIAKGKPTHNLDGEILEPEKKVTNEKTDQNKIEALHSKIHLECVTGESTEIQLGAHSLDEEQNDIQMKSLEQD